MNKRKRNPRKLPPQAETREPSRYKGWVIGCVSLFLLLILYIASVQLSDRSPSGARRRSTAVPSKTSGMDTESKVHQSLDTQRTAGEERRHGSPEKPRFFASGKLTMIWDSIRPDVLASLTSSSSSNIAPSDYVGPEKCASCHAENHANWSAHPHRWMNQLATTETVLGDFSGASSINYLGGIGHFHRDGDRYVMQYTHESIVREYVITQTIGSRFYQYYIGKGLKGPEPEGHDYYTQDHVLPFGYWIERKAWVPIVHVAEEAPEGSRWESVHSVRNTLSGDGADGVGPARGIEDNTLDLTLTYAVACNYCHTTFALGDMFVRMPKRIGMSVERDSYFALSNYLADSHPTIWNGDKEPEYASDKEIESVTRQFVTMEAPSHAATLGVSCEACHLGCREHVENPEVKPPMAPQNPHFLSYEPHTSESRGRTAENINAACGRCHSGSRPTYAAGMATWNSTEHSDAMKGSCYSQLNCADCHDPHKAIGPEWTKPAHQDDASCIRCHQKYQAADARQAHTHHLPGSAGDACMNCHMPRINEGMQDVVRTHTIFSPTQPAMIEAGQPNACNLCHLEKPIDWTLGYLAQWYQRTYSPAAILTAYPDSKQPVGLHWLASQHEATRLAAVGAAAEQDASWMRLAIANMLNDPYLLNRQFAQTSLEKLLDKQLDKAFGYWYYMTPDERAEPIARIRKAISQ